MKIRTYHFTRNSKSQSLKYDMDAYMTTTMFLEVRPGTCVKIVGSSKKTRPTHNTNPNFVFAENNHEMASTDKSSLNGFHEAQKLELCPPHWELGTLPISIDVKGKHIAGGGHFVPYRWGAPGPGPSYKKRS
jgi:hypothetical protein